MLQASQVSKQSTEIKKSEAVSMQLFIYVSFYYHPGTPFDLMNVFYEHFEEQTLHCFHHSKADENFRFTVNERKQNEIKMFRRRN